MSANINPEDNERWLSDGNCAYCRRKTYCGADCTAQKRRARAILHQLILNKAPGLKGVYKVLEGATRGESIG